VAVTLGRGSADRGAQQGTTGRLFGTAYRLTHLDALSTLGTDSKIFYIEERP
jgi:hypothetical protein